MEDDGLDDPESREDLLSWLEASNVSDSRTGFLRG